MDHKPLPIGVDNFEKLIQNDYYYVDKTLFIKELIDYKGESNLFTRPRRFGKTLSLSMFQYFSVITGCLRISKESIFTGLNNLKIASITSDVYSEHFGFTREEVSRMSEYYAITAKSEELKSWYDGYCFGGTHIYNPWSVLNYVKSVWVNKNAFYELLFGLIPCS